MAPAKGNQHGVGHGRPPNEGFSDPELLILGEELLQWMKDCDADPKCDVVHLSEWYSEKKNISPTQWKSLLIARECFLPYYDKARVWMGKRLMKNKDLAPSYGNRFLGIYMKEVHEHEEAIKDRDEERKRATKEDLSQTIKDSVISAVRELEKDSGTATACRSSVENQQSILHKE